MTTLDRPISRFSCRRLFFACEPRFRILRAVNTVKRLKTFTHPGLRRLMSAHLQMARTHSSWSRA